MQEADPENFDQTGTTVMAPQIHTSEDLRSAPKALWYRLHVFLYDLRHFADKPESQARLDQITDASYLGQPYFSASEVQTIKSTTVARSEKTLATVIEETLDEKLVRKKRVESGDYRVCAAHDLAPIFERAFGITTKDLGKDKVFLRLLSKIGLELSDSREWKSHAGSGSAAKKKG